VDKGPLSREAAVRVLARLVLTGAAPYKELTRAGRTMAEDLLREEHTVVYGDGPWTGAWTLADADTPRSSPGCSGSPSSSAPASPSGRETGGRVSPRGEGGRSSSNRAKRWVTGGRQPIPRIPVRAAGSLGPLRGSWSASPGSPRHGWLPLSVFTAASRLITLFEMDGTQEQNRRWPDEWEEKARKAIEDLPAQVSIAIEGEPSDSPEGPSHSTATARLEHARQWFASRGYRLRERAEGPGAGAWTAIFEWTGAMNRLDAESTRFRNEIEEIVRRYAGDDGAEYARRWKQLSTWGMDRSQGDPVKKAALKKRLIKRSGGRCEDCSREFPATELQMHRLDKRYAFDKTQAFGYFDQNIALLCATCHDRREDLLKP
jgi:hypothetical protein